MLVSTKSQLKHLLFFSPAGHLGGAEHNLLNICRYLPRTQFQISVVLPAVGPLAGKLQALGVKTYFLPPLLLQSGQIFLVLATCLWLKLRLWRAKIDLIHANSIFALYVPVYFAWLCRKPVFVHWADFDARLGDVRLVNFFRRRVRIFAVSQSLVRFLGEHGVRPELIQLLYNGSLPPQLSPQSTEQQFRRQYQLAPQEIILGITGRIDDWKGHRHVLRALALLRDLPLRLFILGEFHLLKNPHLQTELTQLITDLQLADRVIFTGFVEQPAELLRYFDIVLCPSDYEPFGLVATEAMAQGKPVIASATGGLQEIVLDEQTGLLFPPGEVNILAEKIRRLAQNPALRAELGAAGATRFAAHFQMRDFINNLVSYYNAGLMLK